jgi:hypothetical protein
MLTLSRSLMHILSHERDHPQVHVSAHVRAREQSPDSEGCGHDTAQTVRANLLFPPLLFSLFPSLFSLLSPLPPLSPLLLLLSLLPLRILLFCQVCGLSRGRSLPASTVEMHHTRVTGYAHTHTHAYRHAHTQIQIHTHTNTRVRTHSLYILFSMHACGFTHTYLLYSAFSLISTPFQYIDETRTSLSQPSQTITEHHTAPQSMSARPSFLGSDYTQYLTYVTEFGFLVHACTLLSPVSSILCPLYIMPSSTHSTTIMLRNATGGHPDQLPYSIHPQHTLGTLPGGRY